MTISTVATMIPPKHLNGEPVKTKRFFLIVLAVLVCMPTLGFAQSNAKPDYKHQHKSAEKYQKTLLKERHKQEKAEAAQAKAYRKQHQ